MKRNPGQVAGELNSQFKQKSNMKSKNEELSVKILMLLKLDAKNLFHRVKFRRVEYIDLFAAKRMREHFKDIFFSRYDSATFRELLNCSVDTITALDQFYTEVEDLHWYLKHTEDMPVTIDDNLTRAIRKLENYLSTLNLYLDAELGINQEEEIPAEEPQIEAPSVSNVEASFFDDPKHEENN